MLAVPSDGEAAPAYERAAYVRALRAANAGGSVSGGPEAPEA